MCVQFPAKEMSRSLSTPEPSDWRGEKHQRKQNESVALSDTHDAGRGGLRQFIAGAAVQSCLKTCSQPKATIALPFVGSRYCIIAEAASVGLGMRSSLEDFGASATVRVNPDSSTAKSISTAKGACRIRHVEVHEPGRKTGSAAERSASGKSVEGRTRQMDVGIAVFVVSSQIKVSECVFILT